MKNLLPYIFAMGLLFSCSPRENKEYKLGELTFDVTGSEEAKAIFKKGHLLLHSFEYQDACEVFLEAQKADPDFAMAYWGEAMTYNHSIWQEQDLEKGREALRKLGETAEDRIGKAKTELEKKFIQSLNILYGEGSKTDRDQAYARFMGE
jgi:tetratricopeptide (TPR) repeat protein